MGDPTCLECAGALPPRRPGAGRPRIYCSSLCRGRATKRRPGSRDSPTQACSLPDCDSPVRAKGLCFKHYKAQRPKAQGKPETRQSALRRKTQLRRARLRDPDAESIDRNLVGVRDGWRCGLCATPVDQRLPYPHPRSASLDHIIPLSKGGRHLYENVQISHLNCNVAKGNRGGGEQLLLIG